MTRRRTLTYVCLCQKLLYVTGWIRLVYLHWEPKKRSNFTLFFSPFSFTVTASDLSTHCCIIISSLLLLLAAAASYHVICLLAVRQLSSGCPLTTCLSFLFYHLHEAIISKHSSSTITRKLNKNLSSCCHFSLCKLCSCNRN